MGFINIFAPQPKPYMVEMEILNQEKVIHTFQVQVVARFKWEAKKKAFKLLELKAGKVVRYKKQSK